MEHDTITLNGRQKDSQQNSIIQHFSSEEDYGHSFSAKSHGH
jgi:hypothetical protein